LHEGKHNQLLTASECDTAGA